LVFSWVEPATKRNNFGFLNSVYGLLFYFPGTAAFSAATPLPALVRRAASPLSNRYAIAPASRFLQSKINLAPMPLALDEF
jgi:hypothetical protein